MIREKMGEVFAEGQEVAVRLLYSSKGTECNIVAADPASAVKALAVLTVHLAELTEHSPEWIAELVAAETAQITKRLAREGG